MTRQRILLSIIILVGIAALVFGGLILYSVLKPKPATDTTPAQIIGPDLSKDYGACTMLDKAKVKTAIGDAGTNLQDPSNDGIVKGKKVGDGMDNLIYDSQACVYAFAPGGTFENGFNSSDALTVVVTKYTNEEGPETFVAAIRAEPLIEEVDDLGDDAFYSSNTTVTGPNASYSFKLQVFIGKTLHEYTIRQPSDDATFTAESAKMALVTIAKSVQ